MVQVCRDIKHIMHCAVYVTVPMKRGLGLVPVLPNAVPRPAGIGMVCLSVCLFVISERAYLDTTELSLQDG